MCDFDSSEDISTIENGGCVGTSYIRDGGAEEDVEAAKKQFGVTWLPPRLGKQMV